MNKYPLWKYAVIFVAVGVCLLYALPNLFGENPAVQISPAYAQSVRVTESTENAVQDLLDTKGIKPLEVERNAQHILLRFEDRTTQNNAFTELQEGFRENEALSGFVVAQTLIPAAPDWMLALNATPMSLGLDLRGGVHFLMEVDMKTAIRQDEENFVQEFRTLLRQSKLRYTSITRQDSGGVRILFKGANTRDDAYNKLRIDYAELDIQKQDVGSEFGLLVQYTEVALREAKQTAVEQNITTLRNRVNELGVAEPLIQRQGEDRIVVQLPGVQDPTRAKEILGSTATLEYRLVGEEGPNSRKYRSRETGGEIWLKRSVITTGDQIVHAASTIDQRTSQPAVVVRLDGKGAARMYDTTKNNVGEPMAVVLIEREVKTRNINGETVKSYVDKEEVISVATIREPFGKNFQTTGLTQAEATNLALLLRAGALKAPVEIVEERTIGPSLGQQNINQGVWSIVAGFVLVLVFMVGRYKSFGMVANVALLLNVVIVVALLSMLPTTLTLPGMAGILLTIGMAIDANVLIYERIREEINNGNSPQASIHSGFEKAFGTIFDANITTLIAAVVLFSFGTGPIKGFAVTLSLGIIASMFTAIFVSRGVINYFYGGKRLAKLPL